MPKYNVRCRVEIDPEIRVFEAETEDAACDFARDELSGQLDDDLPYVMYVDVVSDEQTARVRRGEICVTDA